MKTVFCSWFQLLLFPLTSFDTFSGKSSESTQSSNIRHQIFVKIISYSTSIVMYYCKTKAEMYLSKTLSKCRNLYHKADIPTIGYMLEKNQCLEFSTTLQPPEIV